MSINSKTPTPPVSRWPLPPGAGRVLIVGGTFDPVHAGHVLAAARAREVAEPGSALLFVPAATSPFKRGGGAAACVHRVAMLRLAVRETANAAVWTDEVDRAETGDASYTIDTVRRAAGVAPAGTGLRLLIGADQALRLHEWREARELVALARPLIMMRGDVRTGAALGAALRAASFWTGAEVEGLASSLVDVGDDLPQSSSALRGTIARGGVGAAPPGWLHPAVAAYIESHGLYRA